MDAIVSRFDDEEIKLPHGALLNKRGLSLPEVLPFEQWEAIGHRLFSIRKGVQWAIGDWLNAGERRYGEMYAQAIEATDLSYQTLMDVKWIAGRFEFSRRRENLSWSHHREVATLPPAEADRLLDCAEVEGWSREIMREQVKSIAPTSAPAAGEDEEEESDSSERAREAKAALTEPEPEEEKEPKNVRGTTGENEWFTPAAFIEMARAVLGGIDLDPATHPAAQATIKAKKFYTKADNGLSKKWKGRVWLNPPYSQPLIADFVAKMIAEYQSGRVPAAIMLTHNYTDTTWFQDAAPFAAAICFTRGRVKFLDPEGGTAAPTQGQVFFYFGKDVDRFVAEFGEAGFVVTPVL